MDETVNKNIFGDDQNSETQLAQSQGVELGVRPSLSEVRKSWGFRRSTLARREFMDEVGDLSHSPPQVRRGRSRRAANQSSQTTTETYTTHSPAPSTRSVIEDLQWSASSSPASEDSKPNLDASAGGSLDPSLWHDVGSAFHTAFSLLGGEEGLSMPIPDALPVPDMLEATGPLDIFNSKAVEDSEVLENVPQLELVEQASTGNRIIVPNQEEDSDDMTLMQMKELMTSNIKEGSTKEKVGKAGRGRARGRGRGRGRGKGRGRGRGRGRGKSVASLISTAVDDDDDDDDDVMFIGAVEQQHTLGNTGTPPSFLEMQTSPVHFADALIPTLESSSDCFIIKSDSENISDFAPGQYEDAPEVVEDKETLIIEHSDGSKVQGFDSDALCCVCKQKLHERFNICCVRCHKWSHGDCADISEMPGSPVDLEQQEYVCPSCTPKREIQLLPGSGLQACLENSFLDCTTQSPPKDECVEQEEEQQQELKEIVSEEKGAHEPLIILARDELEPKSERDHEAEMETNSSGPVCIGPGCCKQALPDSVYCCTDCILQHATVTMKTLSVPKVSKSRTRAQKKAETPRATAAPIRISKRLAAKAEEENEEEQMRKEDKDQEATVSTDACDPNLSEAQAPSSKLYTSFQDDDQDDTLVASSSKHCPPSHSTEVATIHQVESEAPPLQTTSKKAEQPADSDKQKQKPTQLPSPTSTHMNTGPSPTIQSPSPTLPRHHETGALMVSKSSFVIPKKQSPSRQLSTSASHQKMPSAPTLPSETRNLLVSPAPSAPSSRPSQPNNQVRQSIQRSLTGILFKRVCDFSDLDMPESEVAKLVASIEMEMFNIFRNTDSKYMNKYRTIMFNLKDPKNKGLLYRVVQGEIGPFRLVRMSQKDMQATKPPEPSTKAKPEVKGSTSKAAPLPAPEAVVIDLPSLNPTRTTTKSDNLEQKKNLPAPSLKTKTTHPSASQNTALPDILSCMLKDTTSEHKSHLFDLKCKICTGQVADLEIDEPAKKKPKISTSRDKHESLWRKSSGADSPLRAPPDSPDTDSTEAFLMESPKRLIIDTPAQMSYSPASPVMDSQASSTLESPASPILESPASPPLESSKSSASKSSCTPVVIPAVSTVTITRRDPRTAASRFSSLSSNPSLIDTTSHVRDKETTTSMSATALSQKPARPLPKPILMKPSSMADPRLYGALARSLISESSVGEETPQFLAKQSILWKGFLNMLTIAKFVTKAYVVSGSAEYLKMELPDTIQIGGRIMPQTVWDYVAKVKTSPTKEVCVIRFQPATDEEEVAYVSLFSYFSSRGRFGVVANSSPSIKDMYLFPLSTKEAIPSILQPLEGPGFEMNRPNLLLGLAIVQKLKRPGNVPQEVEEKKPKVFMSKDPAWIPKPPVLYGSDKMEMFQPYDPESPASTTATCSELTTQTSSTVSVPIPSLTSTQMNQVALTSANASVTQSTSNNLSNKDSTTTRGTTVMKPIMKTLFSTNNTDLTVSSGANTTKQPESTKKSLVSLQMSRTIVDPIVQQFGQKSKAKQMQEEKQDNDDFDRPYDPEEEYDPAMGYVNVTPQTAEKLTVAGAFPDTLEDDVAYDPEDETIFQDIQSSSLITKSPVPVTDSSSCPTPMPSSTPVQASTSTVVTSNLPTGTVVVSAETLNEQQRMLEELNRQIEEQKRQLKEQEEALRQQREAVGMFMAQFNVSDSLMTSSGKALPLSHLPTLQNAVLQKGSNISTPSEKVSNSIEALDSSNLDSQAVHFKEAISQTANDENAGQVQDETKGTGEAEKKHSTSGEIEDSDVAYDPEDESLFDEIQDDVFRGGSPKTSDSLFKTGNMGNEEAASPHSHRSKKRRSPSRRSHRERGHHKSPSRRTHRRSPSHLRKHREGERHRKSDRERGRRRHRSRDHYERHHRKDTNSRQHSHSRRSLSSSRKKHSSSRSPNQHRGSIPPDLEYSRDESVPCQTQDSNIGEDNNISLSHVLCTNENDGDGSDCKLAHEEMKVQEDLKLGNVDLKLGNSESEKATVPQKSSFNDVSCISSQNADRSYKLDDSLLNKLESTIPLRELDPPIRDSPESPDPEPQFYKPSCIENSDSVKEEKDDSNHPSPFVKCEDICGMDDYTTSFVDDKKPISHKLNSGDRDPKTNTGEDLIPTQQSGLTQSFMESSISNFKQESNISEENLSSKDPSIEITDNVNSSFGSLHRDFFDVKKEQQDLHTQGTNSNPVTMKTEMEQTNMLPWINLKKEEERYERQENLDTDGMRLDAESGAPKNSNESCIGSQSHIGNLASEEKGNQNIESVPQKDGTGFNVMDRQNKLDPSASEFLTIHPKQVNKESERVDNQNFKDVQLEKLPFNSNLQWDWPNQAFSKQGFPQPFVTEKKSDQEFRIQDTGAMYRPRPWLERGNDQNCQRTGDMPNMAYTDLHGAERGRHDMSGQNQSKIIGPHRNEWREPERQEFNPVREEVFQQGESGIYPVEKTNPFSESPRPDTKGCSSAFVKVLENRDTLISTQEPCSREPNFIPLQTEQKRYISSDNDQSIGQHSMGQPFREFRPEQQGPTFENQRPTMGHLAIQDALGQNLDNRGQGMIRPGPSDSHFSGVILDSRAAAPEGPEPWRREIPNFGGPRFHRPTKSDRKQLGIPDFPRAGIESNDSFIGSSGPEGRRHVSEPGFYSGNPGLHGSRPESTSFSEPGFCGKGSGSKIPFTKGSGPEEVGPIGSSLREHGQDNKSLAVGGPRPDFRFSNCVESREPCSEKTNMSISVSQGPGKTEHKGELQKKSITNTEQRVEFSQSHGPLDNKRDQPDSNIDRVGFDSKGPYTGSERQDFKGERRTTPNSESDYSNTDGFEPDREGLGFRGPRPENTSFCMKGPMLNKRGPGSTQYSRQEHDANPNPNRPDWRFQENSNTMDFKSGRKSTEIQSPPPDRGHSHTGEGWAPGDVGNEHFRRFPMDSHFKDPNQHCKRRDVFSDGSNLSKQQPKGLGFRECRSERRGQDLEYPGPEWKNPAVVDSRGPGVREKSSHIEDVRYERGENVRGSQLFHEDPAMEMPPYERTDHNFRGSNSMRRINRNAWSRTERRDSMNETKCYEDNWEIHDTSNSLSIMDESELDQGHGWQSCHGERRAYGRRGPTRIHQRPNMPFPGPKGSIGDAWKCTEDSHPDDFPMGPPGHREREFGNEWRDREERGSRNFFRRDRDPERRQQSYYRGRGRRQPDESHIWRQADLEGDRLPNTGGPECHERGPDFMNQYDNNNEFDEFEMEDIDQRGPRGPGFPGQEPGNRDFQMSNPSMDENVFEGGVNMENFRRERKTFETNFRKGKRDLNTRSFGPGNSAIRNLNICRPVPWSAKDDFVGSDRIRPESKGSDFDARFCEQDCMGTYDVGGPGYEKNRHPDERTRRPWKRSQTPRGGHRGLHHDSTFQDSSGPHFSRDNRSFNTGFANQDQKAIKPQRRREGLLPTPTDGFTHFHGPEQFNIKHKQMGHPSVKR